MDALAVRHPGARGRCDRRHTGGVTAEHYFSAEPTAPAQRGEIEFTSEEMVSYMITVISIHL